MFKLFKYMNWKEWLLLILTLCFVAGQVWCNISLPQCTLEISQILGAENFTDRWVDIIYACMKMLGYALGVVLCAIIAHYLSSYVITNLLARVRSKIFARVNGFSASEINKFSIPSLITRSTNDITQLQQVLTTTITLGLQAPLTAILAIINIAQISLGNSAGQLSLVNVVSVIAICLVVSIIIFTVVPKFKKIQKATDGLNLVTRENLTGLKVVRAYSAEKTQEEKFENVNSRYAKLSIFVDRVLAIIEPSLSFIMQGTSLAIVWMIGLLAGENPELLLVMSAFTQYSIFIIMSFTSLSVLFMFVPRGIVSGRRINEVLDTKTSLVDGQGLKPTEKGTISFKNVYFRYPDSDADVLENINFDVKQGQTIAFIGSTGSGKSTLINLIPRFYDCSDGVILINGQNVKDYTQNELHEMIGYVPQKGILFSGSVKDNIKYGNENATDEEIAKAIDISQSNFIYNFPEGLDYHISQGGKNVSGGQKQRLSIARAIIKNPDILIFDDSFSALDYKTDKIVRQKLNENFKDTTKVIVAQRIGTIMNADIIVVLNEGKIVGMGTHKDLVKTNKYYQDIIARKSPSKGGVFDNEKIF